MRTTTVTCEPLGGVTLRTLKLSERQNLTEEGGDDLGVFLLMLHKCVVDEQGEPLKTVDEWDEFGGDYKPSAEQLFEDCMDHNDMRGEQATKKSEQPQRSSSP